MAPTPETSSSVGILEHRVMVKHEGLHKYIRFMTVELHDCSGQCHFSIVMRISFSICMILSFNVREICWIDFFCFCIFLSWGHVVECINSLQTHLWGSVFFWVSACFKSLIRSNNVSMAGSNLTHVKTHGASGVAWSTGLAEWKIQGAEIFVEKHRVRSMSDADQKWWILWSVKLYLHLFFNMWNTFIYVYICVYFVIHIKCVEVTLVETMNPAFLVNIYFTGFMSCVFLAIVTHSTL